MHGFIGRCTKLAAAIVLLAIASCGEGPPDITWPQDPRPAAILSLPLLDTQRPFALASLRGKVVLLDFWGSWCAPCTQSLPFLNDLRNDLPRIDFEVVAVNLDEERDAALDFLQRYPVDYPVLADPQRSTLGDFGVEVVPSSFLIDRGGVIRHAHRGFKREDGASIRRRIEALIRSSIDQQSEPP